jgi:hypothetical protein
LAADKAACKKGCRDTSHARRNKNLSPPSMGQVN